MKDIVERLRPRGQVIMVSPALCNEVIDEIERLRAENERLREALAKSGLALNRIRTNIECTIWPNGGFAKGSPSEKEEPEDVA